VGIIGSEGMVGLGVFLVGTITHDEAVVQIAGSAMKMKASVLREQLRLGSPLQLLLLRYTRAFLHLVSQSIVCSQNHTISERFARWLLMMHDYSESDKLKVTQELIADMLGSRRAGVTAAAGMLRAAGVITTSRGHVIILNRPGLERIACECYGIIRDEFERLNSSQQPASKSA
jgi:CRP-like cAMP-binding protein